MFKIWETGLPTSLSLSLSLSHTHKVIFSPLAGLAGDRLGRIRPIAMFCSVIFICGNLWYSNIAAVPRDFGSMDKPRVWFTLFARLVVGAGTSESMLQAKSAQPMSLA